MTTPTVAQQAVRRRAPVAAWTVVAACTTAVVVFATIRGLASGYQPVGDNALIELRARDVFTGHWPLLGTWSSASVAAGQDLNHPGPLLFDLFAVPVRALGGRAGIAVGAAALNIAALWGSALTARRVGGDVAALATALAAAVLAWTMGSEVLFDAWQPNILVLPFFAFLVLVWAVFAGHGGALPWAVAVGSLCVQAHLSYLFVVPALLGAGVVALWRDSRPALWRRHGRSLLLALAVGLLAWAQPLIEQLFGAGRGNISRLAGGSDDGVRSGLSLAVRMVAAVLAIPPAWFRPGYDTAIPLTPWTQTDDGRRVLDPALPAVGVAVSPSSPWSPPSWASAGGPTAAATRRRHAGWRCSSSPWPSGCSRRRSPRSTSSDCRPTSCAGCGPREPSSRPAVRRVSGVSSRPAGAGAAAPSAGRSPWGSASSCRC